MGKCIYCSCELSFESPIDVCRRCGVGVWGEKMFNAIIDGMSVEIKKGNMELGRVGEREMEQMARDEQKPEVFVERQIISAHHEEKRHVEELDLTPRPIPLSEVAREFSQEEEISEEMDSFGFN